MKKNLMEVSCDPECGFSIRSHNKNEIVKFVKEHAKNAHNKHVGEEEIKSMIKSA